MRVRRPRESTMKIPHVQTKPSPAKIANPKMVVEARIMMTIMVIALGRPGESKGIENRKFEEEGEE